MTESSREMGCELMLLDKYDYHTRMETGHDLTVLPRAAARALEAALRVMPVVVLLGARQTGKTTLVRTHPELATRAYFTLDDLEIRLQAAADPEALVLRAPMPVLDEVQRAGDPLIAIKRAVDRDRPRRPGRFVLTGSVNLLMLRKIGETLAGRAAYVTLWPMTTGELAGTGSTGIWSELLTLRATEWRDRLESTQRPPTDCAPRRLSCACARAFGPRRARAMVLQLSADLSRTRPARTSRRGEPGGFSPPGAGSLLAHRLERSYTRPGEESQMWGDWNEGLKFRDWPRTWPREGSQR